MTEQRDARALLAASVNTDVDMVPDHARIGFFEAWDSLAHLRVILEIEAHIGRQLDADEVVRIESLDDIAALLKTTD
jgi:acyl carrier protein